MQKSEEQNGVESSRVPTELAERLLRRVHEPIGVIDTREAQRMYSRSTEWLAQRFELAHRISMRYGVAEGSPTAMATPLARPPASAPAEDIWSGLRTVSVDGSAAPVHAPAVEKSIPLQAVQREAAGDTEAARSVAAQSPAHLDRQRELPAEAAASVSTGSPAALPVSREIRAQGMPAGELPVQRKSILESSPVEGPRQVPPMAERLPLVSPVPSAERQSMPPAKLSDAQTSSVAPVAGSAASQIARSHELPLLRRTAIGPDNLASAAHVVPRDSAASSAVPIASVSVDPSADLARTVVVREFPSAPPPLAAPLILRRTIEASRTVTSSSQFHPASPPPVTTARVEAPQIMRVIEPASEFHAIPSTRSERSNAVNVAEIAERVYRLLARQIEIARERSGRPW